MNIIFFEIMPIVFLLFIVIIIVLAEKMDEDKDKNKNPINKLIRKELYINFPTKFNVIERILAWVFAGGYILLLLFYIAMLLTVKYWSFFDKLISNITYVNNISIGLTAVVITSTVIVVTFRKDYYLVFNINEVLQTQHFETCIIFNIFTCLASQLLTVIILGIDDSDNLYYFISVILEELVVIVNYVSAIFVLFIIFRVLLSKGYFELSILKQLYKKMWNKDTLLSNTYLEWKKSAVNINLAYLVENYNKTVNKVNIENIKEFQFATLMNKYGFKWYDRAVGKIFNICFVLLAISSIVCLLSEHMYLIILNVIIIFFMFFISKNKKFTNRYYIYFNKLIYDMWGYYIKLNNKEYFCGIVSIFPPRKIENYIHSIQNIVSFSGIGMEAKFENSSESVIKYILEKLKKKLENKEYNCNYVKSIYLLPIFLIGYLKYQDNKENECMKICKNVYKELKLNNSQKLKFDELLFGFSIDISREISKDKINETYCNYWRYLNEEKLSV